MGIKENSEKTVFVNSHEEIFLSTINILIGFNMPSTAYINFYRLLKDVDALIATHDIMHERKQGKKSLEHITKSGILLLCASWELYIEEILGVSISHVLRKCKEPAQLFKQSKKKAIKYLGSNDKKDELKYFRFAGDGWKSVVVDSYKKDLENFNTPKSDRIKKLFDDYLGIDISKDWPKDSDNEIDKFVTLRGSIAHGKAKDYISINDLINYRNKILEIVFKTEKSLCNFLKGAIIEGNVPWKISHKFKYLEYQ